MTESETKCSGELQWSSQSPKAREIGEGYKMFYHGYNTKKNGVAIVVGEKWRDLKNCKVIPGESIASQHRLLVATMEFKAHHKRQPRARVKKIKWYMLKQ